MVDRGVAEPLIYGGSIVHGDAHGECGTTPAETRDHDLRRASGLINRSATYGGPVSRPASYEDDVYGWSFRQAELLRQGRYDDLDTENVAEEIESLGRSQAASLASSYRLIAAHLLKMLFQPERLTRSWQITIVRERLDAESCLKASPSLKPRRADIFDDAYRQARKLASAETGLPLATFPVDPPFTLDELSSEDDMPWQVPGA